MKSGPGPDYTLEATQAAGNTTAENFHQEKTDRRRSSSLNDPELQNIPSSIDLEPDHSAHPNVGAFYIGPIQNDTNWLTMPLFLLLGFVDGAFSPSNVTECRINSLRFMYNVSRLAWHA